MFCSKKQKQKKTKTKVTMSKYRSNYSGRRFGWRHPPGTFVTSCSHCNSKNNVPINGGPDLFKCQKCTKTMLVKNKCHCSVISYVRSTEYCCHHCQQRSCRKCVDCKERFFASGYEKRCLKCHTKHHTRVCTRCKKSFVDERDSFFYTECKRCERVKSCKYCKKVFYAASPDSVSECGHCLDKIQCMKDPDNNPTMFYQKVQLVVEYNAFSYISTKECSGCQDGYDSDDSDHECDGLDLYEKPHPETLIMLVPKILKTEDISINNTVDAKHHILLKYLISADLFKGDKNEITKVRVRKRENKIELE